MKTPALLFPRLLFLLLVSAASAWLPSAAAAQGSTEEAAAAEPTRGMDLRSLESRLRETRAIDPISKLKIKGQIDDLLGRLREVHEAGTPENVGALRQPYERVIGNIQAKLDRDPALANDIVASREAIWAVLSDPRKFRIQTAKGAKPEQKAALVRTSAGQ